MQGFWDMTLCCWVSGFRRFEKAYCLLRGRRGFFETLGTTYLTTQHRMPDDMNPQKQHCEELKSHKLKIFHAFSPNKSCIVFKRACTGRAILYVSRLLPA
jgi:hypothetical protein